MDLLIQDLRYALRQCRKNIGVTFAIVFVLALGIAANAVTFTILKATLLRPLPYPEPDRIVKLWETRTQGVFAQMEFSSPDFLDYREHNQVFETLGGYSPLSATLQGPQGAEQVHVAVCSANFFDVFRVQPSLGRLFQTGEDLPKAVRTVVLTYAGWQRRFGRDPNIIGKAAILNEEPRVIVGVLPRNFEFAPSRSAEFWLPMRVQGWRERRNAHWFHPVGRLKPGVDLAQAQASLSTFASQLERQYPDSNVGVGVRAVNLHEEISGPVAPVLILLMAAVGCFLLIICGNLAALLLTKSVDRQKEISIRLALGAGRGRIVRQLLTESCVLSVFGGLAGVFLSLCLLPAALSSVPKEQLLSMPAWQNLHIDLSFLGVSLVLAVLTGILFGLAPALISIRTQLRAALQESGRSSTGAGRTRLRNALVVAEIALAIVLLHGGGLMLKSLATVLRVNPGFRTDNLMTMGLGLPARKYPKEPDVIAYHRALLDKLSAMPGIRAVATTSTLPLSGGGNTSLMVREGRRTANHAEEHEANSREVSANYFSMMGIPLRAGRIFDERDAAKATRVVILNQTLADRVFPNEDPIGKRIDFTYTKDPYLWEVIGVVGDENQTALDAVPNPVVYSVFAQSAESYMYVTARTAQPPDAMSLTIQRAIREMDSDVAIFDVASMDQIIAESPSIFLRRSPAYLIAAFGVVGLLLAAVGLYSLLAYGVAQRMREMGMRVALGAQKGDLFRLVVGGGMKLAFLGVALGVAGALGVSRLLISFLFNVQPGDPGTLIGVCALLLFVAFLATGYPARRATQVDPMIALRYE
jgi:putative ABC transport system permease protein